MKMGLMNRNGDIKFDCKDGCFMTALTQALLQSRFNKPQDIRDFIHFIVQTPTFHEINLSAFFLHVFICDLVIRCSLQR